MTPDIVSLPVDALAITLLSLKVALVATLFAWPLGIALGFLLARYEGYYKPVLETLILLPMVVPPVSIGLLLLFLMRPAGLLGQLSATLFQQNYVLTWQAAAIASMVVAVPLIAKTSEQAFKSVPQRLEQVAASLGTDSWRVVCRITIPLARFGLLQAGLLGFARALGEFGATNLVAGLIPGETETLALGIFSRISNGQDAEAWGLTGISLALAFGSTLTAQMLARASSSAPRVN